MKEHRIMVKKDVLEKGLLFDGDIICYGGEYGQQVCQILNNGTEEPVTGLIYELYSNSNINYYCYYIDGISSGQYVSFYENGKLKSVTSMYRGTRHGDFTEWYKEGNKKVEGIYKYGFCEKITEWNLEGTLIKEQPEPSEFDKVMIEKYECKVNRK